MNSVESNEDTVQSELQVSVVIAHCNKNSFSLPVEQIFWSGLSSGTNVNLASLIVHTFSSLFYSSELGRWLLPNIIFVVVLVLKKCFTSFCLGNSSFHISNKVLFLITCSVTEPSKYYYYYRSSQHFHCLCKTISRCGRQGYTTMPIKVKGDLWGRDYQHNTM